MNVASIVAWPSRSEQRVRAARFEQLRTEFAANWPTDHAGDVRPEVARVLGPGDRPDPPLWSDLFGAEALLIRHLPTQAVRLKHADLKDEYAATAGQTMAAAYFARLADPKTCGDDVLRFEAGDMLGLIQRMRVSRHAFNRMRTPMTLVATLFAIAFTALIIYYWFLVTPSTDAAKGRPPFALTTLALSGMLGGCISALSRLYSISWSGETALVLNDVRHTFWVSCSTSSCRFSKAACLPCCCTWCSRAGCCRGRRSLSSARWTHRTFTSSWNTPWRLTWSSPRRSSGPSLRASRNVSSRTISGASSPDWPSRRNRRRDPERRSD
jgi:hypothetical protein